MEFPIWWQLGSASASSSPTPLPEFVSSQQTRWVHPFRTADTVSWAVGGEVMVQPFVITVP